MAINIFNTTKILVASVKNENDVQKNILIKVKYQTYVKYDKLNMMANVYLYIFLITKMYF